MQVFQERNSYGTVLSLVPQHHKSGALVRFGERGERWWPVVILQVEVLS